MKMKTYLATIIFVKWEFNPIQMKTPDSMGVQALNVKKCNIDCNRKYVKNHFLANKLCKFYCKWQESLL